MPVDRFIDTNVLLYAYNRNEGEKRDIALGIIEEGWTRPGCNAISVQVLQEFYVNFTRSGQTHKSACQVIEDLSQWPVVDNTLERFGQGLEVCRRFKTSLWDAMIGKPRNSVQSQSCRASHVTDITGRPPASKFSEA